MALGKSLKTLKTEKKMILSFGKSKGSNGDLGNVASKKTGRNRSSKNVQSEENKGDGDSYLGGSKASKRGMLGKRNVNQRIKGEARELVTNGNRISNAVNSDRKRKRIYAEQSADDESVFRDNVRKYNRKIPSKVRPHKSEDDLHEERRTRKPNFAQLSRKVSLSRERKPKGSRLLDKTSRVKFGAKDELKDVEVHGGSDGKMKKGAKSKSRGANQFEKDHTQHAAVPVQKFKKKFQSKKSLTDDSNTIDDRPKKKKRVIRIDPHDLSNKRLDDGISINSQYLLQFMDSVNPIYLACCLE